MRYYYRPGHPKASPGGFVSAVDLEAEPMDAPDEPQMAIHANIMVDRFYEGATVHDGERVRDIGSRRRHRELMKEKGWTTMDDFKGSWAKAEEARRDRREKLRMPDPRRREAIAKAMYTKWKP
jgi:hypothetical protein